MVLLGNNSDAQRTTYVVKLGMQAYIIFPTQIVKTAANFVNFQIITILKKINL